MSKARGRKQDKGNKKKSKRASKESDGKKVIEKAKKFADRNVVLPISVDGGKVKQLEKRDGLNIRARFKLNKKADSSFLVTMLFSNGCTRQFVVATNKEVFKYKGRLYYLRYENAWFDLSFRQYRLFYFDDYAVPIDREVIKKGDENWFSVTSSNLRPLIKQSYVKALQESAELTKMLKMVMIIAGLGLICSAVAGFVAVFGKIGG